MVTVYFRFDICYAVYRYLVVLTVSLEYLYLYLRPKYLDLYSYLFVSLVLATFLVNCCQLIEI